MAEKGQFSLINPEPRLAKTLHERSPLLIPEDLYHWTVGWVEDVGVVIRSREYKVNIFASGVTYTVLTGLTRFFPLLGAMGWK